jgi:eukaryotic-like serine/threonine-protein kinase
MVFMTDLPCPVQTMRSRVLEVSGEAQGLRTHCAGAGPDAPPYNPAATMPLAAGARLGPYEVLSHLGDGGMGEVYRARDTRLDRTVALKVLVAAAASDPRRLERFRQEARAISRLSHPHICTLHDLGEQDGTLFLVMEHVQGRTLANRLDEGPLPIDDVLRYGAQIAEALHAAHAEGVVHRDLKPANVILTREGVKLLDFGVARLRSAEEEEGADPPTVSHLTEEGEVLGTVPYMAPEQLEGRKVDARTDVFALGTTLYEMATGKRPFDAKSRAGVIAAILGSEPPPVSTVRPLAPPSLDWTVRRCLAKDPDDRWQSARDIAAHLRWILEGGSEAGPFPVVGRARPRHATIAAAIAGALVAGAVVWIATRPPVAPARGPTRLSVALPTGVSLALGGPNIPQSTVALSPDGRRLVAAGTRQRTTRLYYRDLDADEAVPLPGTEGAAGPFFSPDGRWVGFWAQGMLKKVALGGGAPIPISRVAPRVAGSSWGRDGTIFFAPQGAAVWAVAADGGDPRIVLEASVAKGEKGVRWPHVLPGGAILFALDTGGDFDDARLTAYVPADRTVKTLVDGGTAPRFLAPGHLVYALHGEILAAPFDPARLEVMSPAVPLVKGVASDSSAGVAHFDVSASGTLVYVSGEVPRSLSTLVWMDGQGHAEPLPQPARDYGSLALSPDGRRLALSLPSPTTHDIWVLDLERGTMTRLTTDLTEEFSPIWTPDGARIAFASTRRGPPRVYLMPADGSAPAEPLFAEGDGPLPWEKAQFPSSISPDGRHLLFVEAGKTSGLFDILAVPLQGERNPRAVVVTPFDEGQAVFSPDGRHLAYVSNESGRREVYVRPFAGMETKWMVSTDGGDEPRWAPGGGELIYRSDRRFLSVSIRTAPTFQAGRPRALFEGDYVTAGSNAYRPRFELTADGRRLLVEREIEPQGEARLNVVLDWLEEVRRRVPPPHR